MTVSSSVEFQNLQNPINRLPFVIICIGAIKQRFRVSNHRYFGRNKSCIFDTELEPVTKLPQSLKIAAFFFFQVQNVLPVTALLECRLGRQ